MSGKVKVVNGLQFSTDGSELASSGWSGFQVWRQIAPGVRARNFKNLSGILRFTFLPHSKRLYALGRTLFHIDLDDDRCDTLNWGRQIVQFALAPDGGRLVHLDYLNQLYTIACRETVSGHPLVWERPAVSWDHTMHFFSSGDSILGMYRDYRLSESRFVIYSAALGEESYRSTTLPEYSDETIVSPDESLLACRTRIRIRIYPVGKLFREPLVVLQNDVNRHFTGIAFHPSGKYLAATSNDTTVKLYDTSTWELARTFTWNIGRMRSICFSPDGTLAAAGSDKGQVVVWDVDV